MVDHGKNSYYYAKAMPNQLSTSLSTIQSTKRHKHNQCSKPIPRSMTLYHKWKSIGENHELEKFIVEGKERNEEERWVISKGKICRERWGKK